MKRFQLASFTSKHLLWISLYIPLCEEIRDIGLYIAHIYYVCTIFKHFIDYRLKQYESLKIDISGGYVTLILVVL